MVAILPNWIAELSLQQQAVLLMALRGPDGFPKDHRCKKLLYYYRGCILKAADTGRMLVPPEKCPSFMSMDGMGADQKLGWNDAIGDFKRVEDELPVHYYTHFMHGCQVLMYKHPEKAIRLRWAEVYLSCCEYLHVLPEHEEIMDARLNDFDRPLGMVFENAAT